MQHFDNNGFEIDNKSSIESLGKVNQYIKPAATSSPKPTKTSNFFDPNLVNNNNNNNNHNTNNNKRIMAASIASLNLGSDDDKPKPPTPKNPNFHDPTVRFVIEFTAGALGGAVSRTA